MTTSEEETRLSLSTEQPIADAELDAAEKVEGAHTAKPSTVAVTPEQVAATAPDEADDTAAPTPDPSLPIAKVRRYKELREAQAASDAEAKAIKEEADKLEAELVEAFSEAGVQNLNVDGKTVYLHRSVYARRCDGITADDVKAALRAAGAGDLVTETVNANTLSAYVREFTEDDDAPGLPAPLQGVLEPGERFGMRIIAGGTKAKSKTHSK